MKKQIFEVTVVAKRAVLIAADSAKEAENIAIDFISEIESAAADSYEYEAEPIPHGEAEDVWGSDCTLYHNGDDELKVADFDPARIGIHQSK